MIFATVGTQLPFPRLIDALSRAAGRHRLDVVAQTADASCSAPHIRHQAFFAPAEFADLATMASVIVGHAGIGTIITAQTRSKPVILYPRRAALGEHRNDHQMATARALAGIEGIYVAMDDQELENYLVRTDLVSACMSEMCQRRDQLVDRLKSFIHEQQ